MVGVEHKPALTTSIPHADKVPHTIDSTILPDNLASLPTTTLYFSFPGILFLSSVAYAEVNFTTSIGVSALPISPPIVPLMPDIDLIKVIRSVFYVSCKFNKF